MKTLKITLGILIIVVSVTLTTICITPNLTDNNLFSANHESITSGETNYNPGDRLKKLIVPVKMVNLDSLYAVKAMVI